MFFRRIPILVMGSPKMRNEFSGLSYGVPENEERIFGVKFIPKKQGENYGSKDVGGQNRRCDR